MDDLSIDQAEAGHSLADETEPPPAPAAKLALSPLALLRNSSKLSGANLLSTLVGFPVNIFVARLLGPDLLGAAGFIMLWQFYATLAKPNMFAAAYREMPGLLAQGKRDQAVRIQNIGITAEGMAMLAITAVLFGASFSQSDMLLRYGIMLTAGAFAVAQVYYFANQVQWAHQRFGLIARLTAIAGFGSTAFTLASVWWLKAYAVVLAPAMGTLVACAGCRIWAGPSTYRPHVDGQEMWRLAKVGVPLALGGLFYWAFRTVDRTVVAAGLSLAELGYFTFAMQFVNVAIGFVSDFGNVAQPALWAAMTPGGSPASLGGQIQRLSLVILLATCAAANLAQAGFGAFVLWFVPNFAGAIAPFEIFALLLACGTAGFVPNLVLTSVCVNRQKLVMVIWGAGIPLNAGLGFLAVRTGTGLSGVAAASVAAQGLSSAAALWFVGPYVFARSRERWRFYTVMAATLAVCLAVFAVFHARTLEYSAGSNTAAILACRVGLAGIIWLVVIGLLTRLVPLAKGPEGAGTAG
ncbi:MAG TPA: lipopolysaccharide biosynthesis protein [Chloroflexota bacterium]|nr:lipopolysaccharide biosynthesis protein [Chloroflexota bacterium]